MGVLRKLISLLLLAMISTTAIAITDNQVFAFAEANYPGIFNGTVTPGVLPPYNYRYYAASGNYLAVATSCMIFILGPYTGNVITSVGPVTDYASAITAWEASSITYMTTWHEVSGNCTLYPDQIFAGTLTPTIHGSNTYTTVFVGGAALTLTVPGNNMVNFSHPDAGGTTIDNMQLTFDSQTRSITGSSNWTHTNGCMGYQTISGSW